MPKTVKKQWEAQMPLHLVGLAHWLLTHAGTALFTIMQRKLLENVGLQSPPLTDRSVETLLNQQLRQFERQVIQQLIERMDEDRLITLRSGIYQLNMAAKMTKMTPLKQSHLTNALSKFADIASLPEQSSTAGVPNSQLNCLAQLGIAAIYVEMQESLASIANSIAVAIYADQVTARQWFGDDIIDRLLLICPKCGFENDADDLFCPRDGQPLTKSTHLTSVRKSSHTPNTLSSVLVAYCAKGHRVAPGTTFCELCKRPITNVYCSRGHINLPGATTCGKCGEALAFSL